MTYFYLTTVRKRILFGERLKMKEDATKRATQRDRKEDLLQFRNLSIRFIHILLFSNRKWLQDLIQKSPILK
jgi:hypothetical protein